MLGVLNVNRALETVETYQELCELATAGFTRRRELILLVDFMVVGSAG